LEQTGTALTNEIDAVDVKVNVLINEMDDLWDVVKENQKMLQVHVDHGNELANSINEIKKELKSLRGMVFLSMKKKKEAN
jgi:hypothetical protein